MQGLWKDKRKHVIRDKSKGLWNREIRKVIYDNVGEETSKVFKKDATIIKKVYVKKTLRYLCNIYLDGKFYIAIKECYSNSNRPKFFDYFTGQRIVTTLLYHRYEFDKKLIITTEDFLEEIVDTSEDYVDYDSNYMLYGKPFSMRELCFNEHGRRKKAQKEVQRSNRMLQRDYLRKGNFEKEVPIHSCTKSINWMID